ncbi:hypothetical protein Q3G72_033371 [Acer saccharum]|nr:hypothetical protein Q3G72_033371 [Acer saccharum]
MFSGENEVRCVKIKLLLEALDTITNSSKAVSIEESGYFKLTGPSLRPRQKEQLVIVCDAVLNSVVAKWLRFKEPAFVGRYEIRGYADYTGNHGLKPKFLQFNGKGFQSGFLVFSLAKKVKFHSRK